MMHMKFAVVLMVTCLSIFSYKANAGDTSFASREFGSVSLTSVSGNSGELHSMCDQVTRIAEVAANVPPNTFRNSLKVTYGETHNLAIWLGDCTVLDQSK
jgi:hypothetical protein